MMAIKYTLENFRKLPLTTKDQISKLTISGEDVLERTEDIRVRRTNIDKGIALGKSKLCKTFIIIHSEGQLYKLETAILGIRGSEIFTEVGLSIPISCVYSVDFI